MGVGTKELLRIRERLDSIFEKRPEIIELTIKREGRWWVCIRVKSSGLVVNVTTDPWLAIKQGPSCVLLDLQGIIPYTPE
jgi:hypothetical protein